ncbi:MAG: hypothetical protein ACTSQ8_25840 [Candidatus Helarchaeota archaeon]
MRETLAAHAHDMWSGWMKYVFKKSMPYYPGNIQAEEGALIIPKWAVKRWTRQMNTIYEDLSEEEKESDRKEADRILKIIQSPNKPLQAS